MMAPDDFYRAMCALGFFPPQEEAEAMFLELDTDGNGKLDFDEFSQFMCGCVLTFHSLHIPPTAPSCQDNGRLVAVLSEVRCPAPPHSECTSVNEMSRIRITVQIPSAFLFLRQRQVRWVRT
jgi:hypothetical protein